MSKTSVIIDIAPISCTKLCKLGARDWNESSLSTLSNGTSRARCLSNDGPSSSHTITSESCVEIQHLSKNLKWLINSVNHMVQRASFTMIPVGLLPLATWHGLGFRALKPVFLEFRPFAVAPGRQAGRQDFQVEG